MRLPFWGAESGLDSGFSGVITVLCVIIPLMPETGPLSGLKSGADLGSQEPSHSGAVSQAPLKSLPLIARGNGNFVSNIRVYFFEIEN